MRVNRAQERIPGKAIHAAADKPRSISRTAIATYGVARGIPSIGVEEAELGVVEDVEGLGTKFKPGGLSDIKVLEQRHVEAEAAWIVQVIPSRVAERQCAWGHKRI